MKLFKRQDRYDLYADTDHKVASSAPNPFSKLSKQNCDEIFRIVNVEKLAEEWYNGNGKSIYTDYNTMPSFIAGFNKAMELCQPTEIEVEIEMECPRCQEWGYVTDCRKDCNKKFLQPKLDSNGCLILRKL